MNDEITLDFKEVCGNNIYTRADGKVLFDKIEDALINYQKVIVLFNGIEIASESFLDEAIVEHYFKQNSDDIRNRIVLRGVTKPDQILLGTIFEYRKRLATKELKRLSKKIKHSSPTTPA